MLAELVEASVDCVDGVDLLLEELETADPAAEERCGLLDGRHEVYTLRIPRYARMRLAVSIDRVGDLGPVTVHGLVPSTARPCDAVPGARRAPPPVDRPGLGELMMSTPNTTAATAGRPGFRDRLRAERPDIAARAQGHEVKRKLALALALRALRKQRGLTQKEVEARSGLSQSMVSRIEAPTGSLPNWETVMRYVAACDGHMLLGFSLERFDEAAFLDRGEDRSAVAAVAV